MQVLIKDSAALRRISPAMLRAYLESNGWTQQEIQPGGSTVWVLENNGEVDEILVSSQEWSYRYPARIYEAVEALSEIEERSQLDVYYELLAAGADVIKLRSPNGNGNSGLSLEDRANFLNHARSLMTAAARAAENPGRPIYRGPLSRNVSDYLREIRPMLGYGTGSDLTIHSRIPADYGMQEDLGDSFTAPFARRATIALSRGLREARKIADTALARAELATFQEAAGHGASANFCAAVADLARDTHGISISLSWAPVRYSGEPGGEFVFTESAADLLAEGADLLRRRNPYLNAQITGEIVRLDREEQEKFDGYAIVLYELEGRTVALQTQFDPADEDKVVTAFRNGIPVSLEGDIHFESRRYLLKNPRNLSVPQ